MEFIWIKLAYIKRMNSIIKVSDYPATSFMALYSVNESLHY